MCRLYIVRIVFTCRFTGCKVYLKTSLWALITLKRYTYDLCWEDLIYIYTLVLLTGNLCVKICRWYIYIYIFVIDIKIIKNWSFALHVIFDHKHSYVFMVKFPLIVGIVLKCLRKLEHVQCNKTCLCIP